MKIRRALLFCLMMLAFEIAVGQEEPIPVGLRNLTSAPQQFDGKLVRLRGFLAIDVQPRHAPVFMLYPGQSDAKNHITSNAVLVIPNQAMIRSEERLKQKYVRIIGTVRAVTSANGSHSAVIKDIQRFYIQGGRLGE